jgi:hypothetical protein
VSKHKTAAVDQLVAGIEAGSIPDGIFAEDAVLDATVPNWRFRVQGGDAVRSQLAGWYADPGHFEAISRTELDDGELVEFTLTWREGGVPHMCHQAHILRVADGRVLADTAFCGGRWPESLQEEMKQAGAG